MRSSGGHRAGLKVLIGAALLGWATPHCLADITVYDDRLNPAWENWSCDTSSSTCTKNTFNEQDPQNPCSGQYSFSGQPRNWGAMRLHWNNPVPASQITAVRFQIRGAGGLVGLQFGRENDTNVSAYNANTPILTPGQGCQTLTIKPSDHVVFSDSERLTDLYFKAWTSGSLPGPFYVDTVELLGPPADVIFPEEWVVQVAAGGDHFLALTHLGRVWTWGHNGYGQLGNGSPAHPSILFRSKPVMVSGLNGVKQVAGGGAHSLAVKQDGTVWAWGSNRYGQLGDNSTTDRREPVPVAGLNNVSLVAAGTTHSLAIKTDGTVWTWGHNRSGQLGNGTMTDSAIPVLIVGFSGVKALAAGDDFSVALKTDGTVWTWGDNSYGQLGMGGISFSAVPVRVNSLQNIRSIAAGAYHVLASDGGVWAWGRNTSAQLGDGTRVTARSTPVRVIGSSPYVSYSLISAGRSHSLAWNSAGGGLLGWGDKTFGQVGAGQVGTAPWDPILRPTFIPGIPWIFQLVSSSTGVLAMSSLYDVRTWGANLYGLLGNGTVDENLARNPTLLMHPPSIVSVDLVQLRSGRMGQPIAAPPPGSFDGPISVHLTRATGPQAMIRYTIDGTAPSATVGQAYTGPILLDQLGTWVLKAVAVSLNGAVVSPVMTVQYTITNNPSPMGDGLLGRYFSNEELTERPGQPSTQRIDPTIDFVWGEGRPDPLIPEEHFSVRWTGWLSPQHSEPYTFWAAAGHGIRFWLNGQLLMDLWPYTNNDPLYAMANLQAGVKYPITVEFHNIDWGGNIFLHWKSPSTPQSPIPQRYLFSGITPALANAPAFNPPAGQYQGPLTIRVDTPTEGAIIRYTVSTDGSIPPDPTGSSPVLVPGGVVPGLGNFTNGRVRIKARAEVGKWIVSNTVSADYGIRPYADASRLFSYGYQVFALGKVLDETGRSSFQGNPISLGYGWKTPDGGFEPDLSQPSQTVLFGTHDFGHPAILNESDFVIVLNGPNQSGSYTVNLGKGWIRFRSGFFDFVFDPTQPSQQGWFGVNNFPDGGWTLNPWYLIARVGTAPVRTPTDGRDIALGFGWLKLLPNCGANPGCLTFVPDSNRQPAASVYRGNFQFGVQGFPWNDPNALSYRASDVPPANPVGVGRIRTRGGQMEVIP
ncbi:MAG: chitobiase/beta-hexosaminidase C-terminal domain-containing protein [Candidatus Omnitrophica bacterium]|nr:chitobiase/beta-hexosaminidase C-terminal domain-containing protein [Candidatus Omnitrophota bacterium]